MVGQDISLEQEAELRWLSRTIIPTPTPPNPLASLSIRDFSAWIGDRAILQDISLDVYARQVLSIVGRTATGKSDFLRAMCRMLDSERGLRTQGDIWFDGENIYGKSCDLPQLRRRVGFLPETNSPFPISIWENVAYGIRLNRIARAPAEVAVRVEAALRQTSLWDEVKDDLHRLRGTELTESQQRRLCLARILAIKPQVLLLDSPAGAYERLDTEVLAEILSDLTQEHSVVCVTSSLTEAARVSDRVAYVEDGRLIEVDTAEMMFAAPLHPMTQDFIANSPE